MKEMNSFFDKIKSSNSIVVSSHIYPDSDAIGSSYALARVLKDHFGLQVGVYLQDSIPVRNASFVDHSLDISHEEALVCDTLVGVDCGGLDRLGWVSEEVLKSYKSSYNIDHHISNTNWAEQNYVFSETSACCEILGAAFFGLGIELKVETLNLLLAGIMDDCGCFRFLNTSAQTHAVAALILSAGGENAQVADRLYFNEDRNEVMAKAALTNTIEFFEDGKVAIGVIDNAFLEKYEIPFSSSLGFSDILKKISGVVHTALIREVSKDEWKVSLRTKDFNGDVSVVAESYGGGGHKMAAGFRIEGSLDKAKQGIVDKLIKAL